MPSKSRPVWSYGASPVRRSQIPAPSGNAPAGHTPPTGSERDFRRPDLTVERGLRRRVWRVVLAHEGTPDTSRPSTSAARAVSHAGGDTHRHHRDPTAGVPGRSDSVPTPSFGGGATVFPR